MNAQAELAPKWSLLILLALATLAVFALVVGAAVWAAVASSRKRRPARPGRGAGRPLPVARRVGPLAGSSAGY